MWRYPGHEHSTHPIARTSGSGCSTGVHCKIFFLFYHALWYAEQKRDFDDFRATRHIYLNVKMPWFVCVWVWESWISWWMYKQWFKQGYHQCLWLYKWSMNVSKDGLTWVYIRAKTNWWKYSLFNINLTFHHALHLPHCLRVPDNMKFMNIVPRNNIKMSICAGAFL